MDAYINKQLEFANRMNVLANFGQNDALVLEAQRMQEFRYNLLGESIQAYIMQMQEIARYANPGAEVYSYISSITGTVNIRNIVSNFESFAISISGYANTYANVTRQWQNLAQSLKTIDFQSYSEVLDTCNITKEEVLADIDAATEELENIDKLNLKAKAEDFWKEFAKKHIALWNILVVFGMILDVGSKCNTFKNWYLPMIQEAYVTVQGTEDYYYIKAEEAKVYSNATSKADVICIIGYGERVIQLEDTNMWRKIVYEDENGIETIGWIAKRNLLSQKDYQFNADKLGE